jgi:hypothetical protein
MRHMLHVRCQHAYHLVCKVFHIVHSFLISCGDGGRINVESEFNQTYTARPTYAFHLVAKVFHLVHYSPIPLVVFPCVRYNACGSECV